MIDKDLSRALGQVVGFDQSLGERGKEHAQGQSQGWVHDERQRIERRDADLSDGHPVLRLTLLARLLVREQRLLKAPSRLRPASMAVLERVQCNALFARTLDEVLQRGQ